MPATPPSTTDPGTVRPPTDWHLVGRTLVISAVGLALAVALMLTAYTEGFANPKPRNIPTAVVGPAKQVAQLDASPALKASRVESRQAAVRMVRDRDVYGALDLGRRGRIELLSANGAGHSVSVALTAISTKLAQKTGAKLTVTELAPTNSANPNGTVEFYCIVFLAVGGALGSSILARVHGPVEARVHFFERMALLLGFSAVLAGAFVFIADVGFGALTGHAGWLFLALWGFTAAIALAAAGVSELLGAAAGVGLTLLFTLLGNTSAGGPVGRPMVSGFFSALDPIFPHGGGLSIVRGVQYFGGAGIGAGILCLAIWAVSGLVLLRVAALRHTRMVARAHVGSLSAEPA